MSTNCVFPPALDDQRLLAYLDDPDGNQEIGHHLELCPYCREKAEALDRFQKRLTTRLYRSTCPSPIELGEYHLRMLTASQSLVVAQHLRECPHCTREVSELEGFLSELSPQAGLLETVKVLIARLAGGQSNLIKQQETRIKPIVPTLRGGINDPIRFEADGIVILLDIQPASEGVMSILGQVAADDQDQDRWTGALVELRHNHELEFSAQLDDLGAFHAEGIPPGHKELRITSERKSIVVISNFEVSP